ncbi:hypothetical protein RZS08_58500, partial [Arthrospira platensis SPKY1]|nr:hypothetical protein [Arthrospira platensis SPKY1]
MDLPELSGRSTRAAPNPHKRTKDATAVPAEITRRFSPAFIFCSSAKNNHKVSQFKSTTAQSDGKPRNN